MGISIIKHIDNNNHFDIISSSVLENNYPSINKFICWSLREEQKAFLFYLKFTENFYFNDYLEIRSYLLTPTHIIKVVIRRNNYKHHFNFLIPYDKSYAHHKFNH